MSRSEGDRLEDIAAACDVIASYVARDGIDTDLLYDAIRVRLIEIGEAVKDLDGTTRALEPDIPWSEIARMRDLLAHRYFDTAHSIVRATAVNDVPRLAAAVKRLSSR